MQEKNGNERAKCSAACDLCYQAQGARERVPDSLVCVRDGRESLGANALTKSVRPAGVRERES